MNNRYEVDIRTGCAGIRDTFHPLYGRSDLEKNSPDLIEYWSEESSRQEFYNNIEFINQRCEELNKKDELIQKSIANHCVEQTSNVIRKTIQKTLKTEESRRLNLAKTQLISSLKNSDLEHYEVEMAIGVINKFIGLFYRLP